MSNLPVDPYDRTVIVEPNPDNPDRATTLGSGRAFTALLSDQPGAAQQFLARNGQWFTFGTTNLTSWGNITGDITDQADLMAMFAKYTPTTGYARVAFTGNYNDLSNLPPLGTVSPLDLDGSTSRFLRGDGTWQIPVDVNAAWGNISGNINAQTDLINLLNLKAPITNPTFQGLVNIPTPPVDDNSTLAINSAWFFGQAFNGTPQMDGVASSGNSTLWARGNHRHPTDTTKIGDAPNDGQQYARQSQTWTVVAPPAGGGGGVWIGDTAPTDTTKYPFWWSSASLQLSIWYNDGNSSQWVDTNGAPSSPPGAWLLQDGTVAAPGLAWASETGLGLFRKSTSVIGVVAQGSEAVELDASGAGTYITAYTKSNAGAQLRLFNNAPGAASFNYLNLYLNPDGNSGLVTNAIGGAPRAPFTLAVPQVLFPDGTVAAPGISFASEPGLGFFRQGAGVLTTTAQGKITSYIQSVATQTNFALSPQTAGASGFYLTNQPNGSANINSLTLTCGQGAYGIAEQLNGTATSKPLTMTFPAGIALNPGPNSVDINGTDAVFNLNKTGAANYSIIYGYHNHSPRWNIVLGGAAANSGGNAGDDFSIGSYADNGAGLGTPLSINRASGVVSIPGLNAGATTLGATTVQTNNTAVGLTIADFGNAGAGLAISAANGAKFIRVVSNILYYVNNANTQYIASLTDDGRFSPLAGYVSRPGSAAAPGANVFNFYWGAGLHAWVDSTDLGAISVTSDERIKRNIRPLDLHETEFMAIQPIEYEFDDVRIWTADGVNRWGFSAQNLVQAIPDSAAVINEETPMPTKAEDSWSPLNVDDRPILALTVRQVQDLITRVRALEAKL